MDFFCSGTLEDMQDKFIEDISGCCSLRTLNYALSSYKNLVNEISNLRILHSDCSGT